MWKTNIQRHTLHQVQAYIGHLHEKAVYCIVAGEKSVYAIQRNIAIANNLRNSLFRHMLIYGHVSQIHFSKQLAGWYSHLGIPIPFCIKLNICYQLRTFWKTNQIVTPAGLFHFLAQANGYTHVLPMHSAITSYS